MATESGGAWAEAATAAQLGAYVEQLRRTRGLTQADLADLAAVPRRFVNELEGGHATLFARRLFDVLHALDARVLLGTGESNGIGTGGGATPAPHDDESAPDEPPALRDLGW